MPRDYESELKTAVDKVLRSTSHKKLIVAGPGTGKTTLFHQLLEQAPGDRDRRLVLTFINNLKDDLDEDLSDLARVYTLHGYSQLLLHQQTALRGSLSSQFRCQPGLASLIKSDWEILEGSESPHFVEMMRDLQEVDELGFYLGRGDYYDAVDFDDSVYRVYIRLRENPALVRAYDLVLVDEYQDFNRMEGGFISLLSQKSPIVIAGDDDQALYSQLRGSSWELIRELYRDGEYEIFELPFCMRCPEVVVDAVNDIVTSARGVKRLEGRITKPFYHYEPVKGEDSRHYPRIVLMHSTVQRANANYFGRYIEQQLSLIPANEAVEAASKGDPLVLVIGSKQYLRQIGDYLTSKELSVDMKRDAQKQFTREDGLRVLREDGSSNLGWRLILEFERAAFRSSTIKAATMGNCRIVDVLKEEYRSKVLREAGQLGKENDGAESSPAAQKPTSARDLPIKLTSFEGAKGLSAYHIFVVGLHEHELPRDRSNIQDIEICRLVVGLTRTRKQCTIMITDRFADEPKHPSVFLSWIRSERYRDVPVDAAYWKKKV